ncbi:hypothetical protein [Pseudomonas serbica]|uniref:hypothetical protein n=1 Tax=Pseudomonas serbica TaxID=2965074 RepID=UPI00237BDABF|nr:hypothetical protein [Pseudomonas serbica]
MSTSISPPLALSVVTVFIRLIGGTLTPEMFDSFVESMRQNPVYMEIIEADLQKIFIDADLEEDATMADYEERNREYIDEIGLETIKTLEYQQFSLEVLRWFEVNTRQFEVNFVAGIKRLPPTLVLGHMTKNEQLLALTEFPLKTMPNLPTCRLISMFLQSRPEGYFKDADLDYHRVVRLKHVLGDRLLAESKKNLPMAGHIFAQELGV